MAEAKAKLGKIACPVCAEPGHLRENAQKTLSFSCPECDFSAFAKHGTAAADRLRAMLPKEPTSPETKPTPEAKPGFQLGKL